MNKKWILVWLVVLLALTGGFFAFRNRFSPAQAKLEIAQTNVPSQVFINGVQVSSSTPYEEFAKPGEITLRLVPVSPDKPRSVWETKITLTVGVTTVVRRDFGETDADSSGEILSFEKIGGKKAELAVVSVPDASEVEFDGNVRGYTPLPITNATSGQEHTLSVSHPDYTTREVTSLKPVPGYKLTAIVYLAQDPESKKQKEQEASSSATPVDEPKTAQVEIQETGTGFLRVRQDASKTSPEVAQVKPGQQFILIEESKDGEWYKIEYEKGKTGWISAQYAKKV